MQQTSVPFERYICIFGTHTDGSLLSIIRSKIWKGQQPESPAKEEPDQADPVEQFGQYLRRRSDPMRQGSGKKDLERLPEAFPFSKVQVSFPGHIE
jgi:hypothetical protein